MTGVGNDNRDAGAESLQDGNTEALLPARKTKTISAGKRRPFRSSELRPDEVNAISQGVLIHPTEEVVARPVIRSRHHEMHVRPALGEDQKGVGQVVEPFFVM
jgi:hypothetical protein